MQFFLDFVYEFAQKNIGNIAGFIDHWELNKDKLSVIVPEGEDVQIMTIHTSKGLEFPIVIYPYANESLEDTRFDDIWVPLLEGRIKSHMYLSNKNGRFYEVPSALYQKLPIENEFDASISLRRFNPTRATPYYFVDPKKPEEVKNDYPGLLKGYLQSLQFWN